MCKPVMDEATARPRPLSGVNLFGYLTSPQSQGVVARNLVTALRAGGIPVALTDVRPAYGETGTDTSACPPGWDEASALPYPLTIFAFNPADTEGFLRTNPRVIRKDRITAMVVFVEHRQLRRGLRPALQAVDLILTPTAFVAEAMKGSVPSTRCVPFSQAVFLPADVVPTDRERLGFAKDTILFASAFDTYSDSERKNPMALVNAFQRAFPNRTDVGLLIKVGHLADERPGGQARELSALAATDPRIQILTQTLPYGEILSLYQTADVIVSLHRSEGLGLLLMEGMSLGKAVIATRFSGNLDYMTDDNSILVDAALVPVQTTYPDYAELADDVWAEPDLDGAVHALQDMADQTRRRALGRRAAADMAVRRAQVSAGQVADALAQALSDGSARAGHRRRRARLLWLAHRPQLRYGRAELRHLGAVKVKAWIGRVPRTN